LEDIQNILPLSYKQDLGGKTIDALRLWLFVDNVKFNFIASNLCDVSFVCLWTDEFVTKGKIGDKQNKKTVKKYVMLGGCT
jgi:hypothetical protein